MADAVLAKVESGCGRGGAGKGEGGGRVNQVNRRGMYVMYGLQTYRPFYGCGLRTKTICTHAHIHIYYI